MMNEKLKKLIINRLQKEKEDRFIPETYMETKELAMPKDINRSKRFEESLKRKEGFSSEVYDDGTGRSTAGYGSTYKPSGEKVTEKDILNLTPEEASAWKKHHLDKDERNLNHLLKRPLNRDQYEALLDTLYNRGYGAFSNSKMLESFNEGDMQEFKDSFTNELPKNPKIRRGILLRRLMARERALMPQSPKSLVPKQETIIKGRN